MDRMAFIPGAEAKDELFKAAGHVFFQRPTAIAYADEFLLKAAQPMTGITHQAMLSCMSEGDQVDIWFGLRDPEPSLGHDMVPSGQPVGHTWAILKSTDGKQETLWEVGRATPSMGDAHAARASNAYREAFARFQELPLPPAVPVDQDKAHVPPPHNDKPVISHALSPANLYYASGRMWYFVDLGPADDVMAPAHLSRPMRAFDALILSSLMTLVNGTPPLVFALANTTETLGQMPIKYKRVSCEADGTLKRPPDTPLVVL
ncbi:hypothetical protein J3459_017602 [Metarhizium acridum]|uniref:Uncharacterized protein n=1 Tax=Metarhizium acridum (strain CQMa 102) TaxID=655827 RepID=E9EAV2_METAQ|nr:uncharacterized protein MAC_07000 [Metarhizium acridum CQMa 102]EFY86986.1 hypothetical protein MAC_07000 [Metarhizium acridum CQMa 102]KAG8406186.1 hypothetical protein J3458_021513 [Metarhizium acridum]KAG8409295.1 hypothetical protein J3459_017602 [Metarhizium acridum]KAG8411054.1 hypothetical protein J3458_016165 [Metarhizium acridum]